MNVEIRCFVEFEVYLCNMNKKLKTTRTPVITNIFSPAQLQQPIIQSQQFAEGTIANGNPLSDTIFQRQNSSDSLNHETLPRNK